MGSLLLPPSTPIGRRGEGDCDEQHGTRPGDQGRPDLRRHRRSEGARRHRHQRRQDHRHGQGRCRRRTTGHRRHGDARCARLRRPPHPLRRPGVLGSVLHAVRLARHHLGGDRQLRLRVRPGATGGPGVCDAIDDQGRGHPLRFNASRHAVGLGHVPRVSRQPRPHAEGPQHPALRADRADAGRGVGPGRRQGRPHADRRRARAAGQDAAPVDGRRWLRLVRPAAAPDRAGRGAAGLGRHADADRHDERRDLPGLRPGAGRAESGCAAAHADHRRRPPRHGTSRGDRLDVRPAGVAQRGPGVRVPTSCASQGHRLA